MDHNLEESINLENAMAVDFEQSENVVVSQAELCLDNNARGDDIPMEFEHIEEQPMLIDTGNEEIVSDLMGDQFALQEYAVQDQTSEATITIESNQQNLLAESETVVDVQFDPQIVTSNIRQEMQIQPKIIAVKAALPPARSTVNTAPRQVAIAPKPDPKAYSVQQKSTFVPGKQYPIAPRPVALVTSKSTPSLVKKVAVTGVVHGNMKGNTILNQIGKQVIMMPAGSSQKIKLVTAAGTAVSSVQYIRAANADQAKLIATKNISGAQTKPVTKFYVQGQQNLEVTNQPAVITKLLPADSAASSQTRYVMQQKTVPIRNCTVRNKILVTSPSKQTLQMGKKQVVTIKSPSTAKLLPVPTQGHTTKKVVITANPTQNVILKNAPSTKTQQVINEGNVINLQGQHAQLHQINVPGKGVQYIRLITSADGGSKPSAKAPSDTNVAIATSATNTANATQSAFVLPAKALVLTDSKGNLVQMCAEKITVSEPPPLVVTGTTGTINKLTRKPQRKLVRIAPVVSQAISQSSARSGQSLLAPLPSTPMEQDTQAAEGELEEYVVEEVEQEMATDETGREGEVEIEESKTALRALIADTVSRDENLVGRDVKVEYDKQRSPERDEGDPVDRIDSINTPNVHSLIVVHSNNYMNDQQDDSVSPDEHYQTDNDKRMNRVSVDAEIVNLNESPKTPQALSETDVMSTDLGLRPRKACNCTKSQCLKLYCDCFAHGEFCYNCNCNNCHNNLKNEELRQKAIRGCLDRNPNAFRPKIGKAKSGGLDIIRRHNKGCNCKRSGCLKNYCECFEAKIACSSICKCVGCRNVQETLERVRRREAHARADPRADTLYRPPPLTHLKQPCSFMTTEVIEAVCQCLLAAAVHGAESADRPDLADLADLADHADLSTPSDAADPVRDVIEEFSRCLQDIISAAHQATPLSIKSFSQNKKSGLTR